MKWSVGKYLLIIFSLIFICALTYSTHRERQNRLLMVGKTFVFCGDTIRVDTLLGYDYAMMSNGHHVKIADLERFGVCLSNE